MKIAKQKTIVELIAAVLLVFFVHTSISIFIQFQSLKNMLTFYTLHTTAYAWLVLGINVLAASLLFFQRTRIIGFIITIAFAIGLAITVYKTPRYPHDFGGIINSIGDKKQYILYSLFVILSLVGIWLTSKKSKNLSPEPRPAIST